MPKKKQRVLTLKELSSDSFADVLLSLINKLTDEPLASWEPGLQVLRSFIETSLPPALIEDILKLYIPKVRDSILKTETQAVTQREVMPYTAEEIVEMFPHALTPVQIVPFNENMRENISWDLSLGQLVPLDSLAIRNKLAESVTIFFVSCLRNLNLNDVLVMSYDCVVGKQMMFEANFRVIEACSNISGLINFTFRDFIHPKSSSMFNYRRNHMDCARGPIDMSRCLRSTLLTDCRLKSLHLTHVDLNLKDVLRSVSEHCTELTHLNLRASRVSDEDVSCISKLHTLVMLDLSGTLVTQSCAAFLLTSLNYLESFGWSDSYDYSYPFCKLLIAISNNITGKSSLNLKNLLHVSFSETFLSECNVAKLCPKLEAISLYMHEADETGLYDFLQNFRLLKVEIVDCIFTAKVERFLTDHGKTLTEIIFRSVSINFTSVVCMLKQCQNLTRLVLENITLFNTSGDSIIPHNFATNIHDLVFNGEFSLELVELLLSNSPNLRAVYIYPTDNPEILFNDQTMANILTHNQLQFLEEFDVHGPNDMTMHSVNMLLQHAPNLGRIGYLRYWKVTEQNLTDLKKHINERGWDLDIY